MPPYATCNLTVFDAQLLKYNMACCDLLLVRCRRLQRSAKCKYTHYRSTYCLGIRGADVTVWDSDPGSREFGEPLNSRSRILAPNWREITGVDCTSPILIFRINITLDIQLSAIYNITWYYIHYPTLACEFQGFRVWGKFVFRTLELTDTPTNLANQVKIGHALD